MDLEQGGRLGTSPDDCVASCRFSPLGIGVRRWVDMAEGLNAIVPFLGGKKIRRLVFSRSNARALC